MPTYSFECPFCKQKYELFLKITEDKDGFICKGCETPLRQVIEGGSFHLKGRWPGKSIKEEKS